MALESQVIPVEAVAGFWSYAHEDDKLDGGSILDLAHRVADEYNFLSGEPIEIFVDRSSMAWGDNWRERIDSALSQTTFFIPIITPRYFTRPECRRELLEFAGKARSLGVSELLLPILYTETPNLATESMDEAIALIDRTQYEDWRSTRLLDPNSSEYKVAVNALARHVLQIAKKVTKKQLGDEINPGLENSGTNGIAELVDEASALVPGWLQAVQGEQVNEAQMDATRHVAMGSVERLRRAYAPA